MNAIMTVSIAELMYIWGELVEAYYGVNGYGGNVAEIYAYRLQPYTPTAHGCDATPERQRDVNYTAAQSLVSICAEFCKRYDCVITIDRMPLTKWLETSGFSFGHRAHVAVSLYLTVDQ